MVDLDDVIPLSDDPHELAPFLRQLVGKPFLFFRESYGEELTLHLGVRIPYHNPRMAHLQRGSFIIAARASAWSLTSGVDAGFYYTSDRANGRRSGGPVRDLELAELERRKIVAPDSVVVDVAAIPAGPNGFVLHLVLSDGTEFHVIPFRSPVVEGEADDSDLEIPLSDWEIFMPRSRVLAAGPGPYWSYLDTRVKPSAVPTLNETDN